MEAGGPKDALAAIDADLRRARGLREKEERHQRVLFLAAAGYKPSDIGWRVGMRPDYVRKLIARACVGVRLPAPAGDRRARYDDAGINVMWHLDDPDKLRDEMRRYAAQGARLTREGLLDG